MGTNQREITGSILVDDIVDHLRTGGTWVDEKGERYDNTIVYMLGDAHVGPDGEILFVDQHGKREMAVESGEDFISLDAINAMESWPDDTHGWVVIPVLVPDSEPTTGIQCSVTGKDLLPRTHVLAWGDPGCAYDLTQEYSEAGDAMDALGSEVDNFIDSLGYTMVGALVTCGGRRTPNGEYLKYEVAIQSDGRHGWWWENPLNGEPVQDDEMSTAIQHVYRVVGLPYGENVGVTIDTRKANGTAPYIIHVYPYEG